MPPRRAAAAAKAAAEAEAPVVKAAATKKTTKTTKAKAAAPATAKKPVAAAKTKTATVTKRKRADEEEAAPKTNGVKTATKTAATKAAPTAAAAKKTAAAAKKAKAAETGADKENDAPAVNGDGKKKRATATAAKAKAAKPAAAPAKKAAPKRKAREVEEEAEESEASEEPASEERPAKVARKTKDTTAPVAAAEAVAKKPVVKIGVKINEAPTTPLDVFVFGEGGAGELGLGSVRFEGKKPMDVKRPRINHNLSAATVGVVQIAAGGMHAVALTKDNKILTWGVNDQGALGRSTAWDGGLRDADAESDDGDDDDTGLNPLESTPGEIDTTDVAPGTKFVQVVASDSASFALTEDGRIYGWGTFRASDGVLGFSKDVSIQKTPVLLPEPKKVKSLATGSNHILALDAKGKLFTWGCPEQNQLGRRCVQRDIKDSALRPGGVGFKRGVHVEQIACGSYHSFAVDQKGRVYAWGLNNFGQLNVGQGAGDTDATVLDATLVAGLADCRIVDVDGGEHHSLACTDDGKLLTWGRIDGHQVGLEDDAYNEDNAIFDEHGKPRILKKPTVVPDVPAIAHVNAGTDNSFALTEDGKVFSWGFSGTYQTGQGTTEDVEVPTQIDNTAVRDRKIKYASGGGQFSILASEA